MPVASTDAATLAREAACYCFNPQQSGAVLIYLLNQLLDDPLTPAQLMDAAKCFQCIPAGNRAAVQTYLLAALLDEVS